MTLNNYRPISTLPIFSKILERLMYNRLLSYINKNNILYSHQFGFRTNHGTDLALISLVDYISNALSQGELVCGVFLDFSKAFDTINHKILLNKLYKYGIRGILLNLFDDYLSQREQYVTINEINSDKCKITCGVPQGSVLGPLLFLLYVNDLANVSKLLFPILFADDTSVFLSDKNINTLISTVNQELEKIIDWLCINRLSLNIDKTNFMIFTLKIKISNDISVKLNGKAVNRVGSVKFLGVVIDYNLSWQPHLQYLKNKISKGLGILCKGRKIFKRSTLLTLYYSFIYPYFTYCLEVWGSASNCYLWSVVKLQKRAIRIISSANYRSPTEPLFKSLNVLPLSKLYEYKIILFMLKYNKNMLPNLFCDMFIQNAQIHSYSTRQASKLHVPKGKSGVVYKTAKYKGIYLWNYICNKIDYNCAISHYKYKLRAYLFANDIPPIST